MSIATRKDIGRAVDAALMLKLRRDGYPIEHIAGVVSLSPLACLAAINDALKEIQGDSREYATQIREIELQRLDLATKAIMDKVEDGSHADIDMMLKLQKRRSAYLGLDAPVSANTNISGVVTIVAPWMSPSRLAYLDNVTDATSVEAIRIPS